MKLFLLALIALTTTKSFAGIELGNGGDVVVCPTGVTLLDIYEASSFRGLSLDLGPATLTVDQKVQLGLTRLAVVDPWRAQSIADATQIFKTKTLYRHGIVLSDIQDSNEVYVPVGCHLEQIAIQKRQAIISDPDFVVNEDLWDQLDNDNKAALILHESIFYVSSEHMGSPLVRYLNSMMFTKFIEQGYSPNNTIPNQYFYKIIDTPLADRLEDFQLTTDPKAQGDNRWFFQVPNIVHPQSWRGWSLNSTDTATTWGDECTSYGGTPITVDDLQKIRTHLDYLFRENYSGAKVPAYALDANGMIVLIDQSNNVIADPSVEGNLWCVSATNPFQLKF